MPSVIYIAVNRTIRNECVRMLKSALPRWRYLQMVHCEGGGTWSTYQLGLGHNSIYPRVTLSVPDQPPNY